MKICTKCECSKELSEFSNKKSAKDGKRSWCKKCESENNKEWHKDNPEKHNKRSKKWREENPDKVKESSRKKYEKEKIENPDKIKTRRDKWRKNNPDKVSESSYRHRLKKEYGLSVDDYVSLHQSQSGKCAICKMDCDSLSVDHNHNTGKVRGLLCPSCNLGIGHLKDNLDILTSAIDYLKRNG